MDWKQVRKLVEDLSELLRPRPGSEGLEEIEVQEGDLRIRVRRGGAAGVAPVPAPAAAPWPNTCGDVPAEAVVAAGRARIARRFLGVLRDASSSVARWYGCGTSRSGSRPTRTRARAMACRRCASPASHCAGST